MVTDMVIMMMAIVMGVIMVGVMQRKKYLFENRRFCWGWWRFEEVSQLLLQLLV